MITPFHALAYKSDPRILEVENGHQKAPRHSRPRPEGQDDIQKACKECLVRHGPCYPLGSRLQRLPGSEPGRCHRWGDRARCPRRHCQCATCIGSDDGDSGRGLPTGDTGLARYLAVAAIGYPMDNRGRDEPGTLCRLFVYRPVLLDGAWNDGGPFDARSLLPVYVGLIYMLTHEMGLSWV